MIFGALRSPEPTTTPATRPPIDRLDTAFWVEECRGRKLAFRLRLIAAALIALLLLAINPWPQVLYYHALMLGFVVTGACPLISIRLGPGSPLTEWGRWLVPLADMALVTFALVYPNPFGGDEWMTRPMRLRLDNGLYLLLFVALSTLSYSPRQVLWTGVAGAICWTIATVWVGSLPGVRWLPMEAAAQASGYNDPQGVMAQLLLKQVVLLLVVSGVLAGAVARNRALVLRQVRVERERTQLARYFSANLVDQLADADRPLGEIRNQSVAVLFADIVGFTTLSEAESPERVISLLREFHQLMQAAVFAHHGTLDKYLGDGLMATFGTPYPGKRDAANALGAARAMAASLAAWNQDRRAQGEPLVRVGIGVHWGPVVLGDIGGDNRLEFATIGDTVNVASRVEHMTRDLAAEVAASDDLVQALRASIPAAEAEALLEGFVKSAPQTVRGRSAQLEIFCRPRGSFP
jgi:adenylate cyclase